MQPAKKPTDLRRRLRYPASIELDSGGDPLLCTLCDASQDGAQLQVADPARLPDEFTLLLGYQGTARRRCKVVSRTETEVEVKFQNLSHAAPRSHPGAAAEALPSEPNDAFDIDSLASR